jgi:uncharacterized protein YdaU (DUF1376 family)
VHYFKLNIGDYHKKAGRLTMLEHGAYTLLLHACYDREKFPTKAEAIDWCWARTADEVAAVEFVLSKFFVLVDGLYVQTRISEEIENFRAKSEKNKHIALEREAGRRTKRARNVHESSRPEHEAPPNQEPITNNQSTPTGVERPRNARPPAVLKPEGVSDQVWDDWQKLRKAKKAPVTETVLRHAVGQAEKADLPLERFLQIWCARGSQGLEADWLKPSELGRPARSSHNFADVDYRKGINDDGSFE